MADKVVIRSTCHTGHNCLNDNQVKILIKGQELKKMVESNIAQTVQELFRAAQDELVADNVPDNVVRLISLLSCTSQVVFIKDEQRPCLQCPKILLKWISMANLH